MDEADYEIDEVVETEPAVKERYVSRVYPVGDEDVMVGQQRLDGAPQQGREVARERRDDQDGRPYAGGILAEVEQVAKRIGGDDLLVDGNLLATDRDGADAEIGPTMRHAGVRQ